MDAIVNGLIGLGLMIIVGLFALGFVALMKMAVKQ